LCKERSTLATELLHAAKELKAVKEGLDNFDQQIGVQIIANALKVRLRFGLGFVAQDWCCACKEVQQVHMTTTAAG
jgi:hypothetical protein